MIRENEKRMFINMALMTQLNDMFWKGDACDGQKHCTGALKQSHTAWRMESGYPMKTYC